MKKILFIACMLLSFAYGQSYSPALHTVTNKALGIAQANPTDARSYYYDASLFKYRAYQSTSEVNAYLNLSEYRTGQFSIILNVGGTLNPDGTFSGGSYVEYWYKDGVADIDLVVKSSVSPSDTANWNTAYRKRLTSLVYDSATSIVTLTLGDGSTLSDTLSSDAIVVFTNGSFTVGDTLLVSNPAGDTAWVKNILGGSGILVVPMGDTVLKLNIDSSTVPNLYNLDGRFNIPRYVYYNPNTYLFFSSDIDITSNDSVFAAFSPNQNYINVLDNDSTAYLIVSKEQGFNFGFVNPSGYLDFQSQLGFGGFALNNFMYSGGDTIFNAIQSQPNYLTVLGENGINITSSGEIVMTANSVNVSRIRYEYGAVTGVADTVLNYYGTILQDLTGGAASRTIDMGYRLINGFEIVILNQNDDATYKWSFTGSTPVYDKDGSTVTTITDKTNYRLAYLSSSWGVGWHIMDQYDIGGGADATTASNGLTESGDNIKLGGTLTENTTLTHSTFSFTHTGDVLLANTVKAGKGRNALQYNTALGAFALDSITTGDFNTAIGYLALANHTTGNDNTAVGLAALRYNTTGSTNTALGRGALGSSISGNRNTANGEYSLFANTTGNTNTGIGYSAGDGPTIGSNNIYIGYYAGRWRGTTATVNTAPDKSIFIGDSTKAAADSQTNQIVIGHNAVGAGSNTATLGKGLVATYTTGKIRNDTLSGTGSRYVVADANGDLTATLTVPLSASATLDFPSTSGGAASDLTITVTGAADGDIVAIGVPNGSVPGTSGYFAWVSAADTVTIRFANQSGSPADPASGTFKVRVFK